MKCPVCDSDDFKVIDSRYAVEQNAIRRRRECQSCGKRYTTFETMELNIQVKKRDGRFEDFEREKLIQGMESSCHHTKISREEVHAIASEVSNDIMQRQQLNISTKELGEIVMERLLKRDAIAYIRFACVYRRFKDINELKEAIATIQAKDEMQPDWTEETTDEREEIGSGAC